MTHSQQTLNLAQARLDQLIKERDRLNWIIEGLAGGDDGEIERAASEMGEGADIVCHSQPSDESLDGISGTALQQTVDASYTTITKLFGMPWEGDGYKSDALWVIEFKGEGFVTVYNWKNGKNYLGEMGTPIGKISHWNIGSKCPELARRVRNMLSN